VGPTAAPNAGRLVTALAATTSAKARAKEATAVLTRRMDGPFTFYLLTPARSLSRGLRAPPHTAGEDREVGLRTYLVAGTLTHKSVK